MSYNYAILNRRARCVKIGYTKKSAEGRLAACQTGCPDLLELVGYWPGAPSDETAAHTVLGEYRERGEWFRVAPRVIEYLSWFLPRRSVEMLNSLIYTDPAPVSLAVRAGKPRTGSVYYSKKRNRWIAQMDWKDANGRRRQVKRTVASETDGREVVKNWIAALANGEGESAVYGTINGADPM